MEIILIALVAFAASILTFFSGFGLGTLLTPVFLLFFQTELAIAFTGIVHLFNNIFKIGLLGRNADRAVLLRFGVPAILGALAGAWLMLHLGQFDAWLHYAIGGKQFSVYPLKSLIGFLLLIFALMDLIPSLRSIEFSRDKLIIGGVLSGFFGGLSGNQGALRSAFLIRAGLSKEAFIATAVVISALVDFSRLGVYTTRFLNEAVLQEWPTLSMATLAAIAGAFIGNKMLKKVTISFIQKIVAVLLILLSLALIVGFL